MANSENPFEDPEIKAMMDELGIVHKPGMADELMRELAPLLAEQGVDLDGLDSDADIDRLNEAMAYATERYNMELMTPVGRARGITFAFLRDICIAVHDGQINAALQMIADLSPYESETAPSVGHVTGVSLDLLDRWLNDSDADQTFAKVGVPRWPAPIREAAKEVLGAARNRSAFDSSDSLVRGYRGLVACQAPALLVGHALAFKARKENADHGKILDTYLTDRVSPGELGGWSPGSAFGPGATPGAGSAFGPGATSGRGSAFGLGASSTPPPGRPDRGTAFGTRRSIDPERFFAQFEEWDAQDSRSGGGVRRLHSFFRSFASDALEAGYDVHEPSDYLGLLDWLEEVFEEDMVENILLLLHLYVQFRQQLAGGMSEWDDVDEEIRESTGSASSIVTELMEEALDVDEEVRRQAILGLTGVNAIPEFLEFIGKSRQITPSGLPRRVDIEPVAAMLGIKAVGAAKEPPVEDRVEGVAYVQSAGDIREIAAWWNALRGADVIELSATRVYPGYSGMTDPSSAHISELEMFLAMIVGHTIMADISDDGDTHPFERVMVQSTLERLAEALGMIDRIDTSGPYGIPWHETWQARALERIGVLTIEDGVATIPDPFRFTMLNAFSAIISTVGPDVY